MTRSKIPPIEIDTDEYQNFKLLTHMEGKTMSGAIRELITKYNKSKKNRRVLLGTFMSDKYKISLKGTGITSTNYKDYLYGDKSEFANYGNS